MTSEIRQKNKWETPPSVPLPILSHVLEEIRQAGKKAFVPFIMAGDPGLSATELFVQALVRGGASAIELGVPFSDPVADGPVNQRAAERALRSGTSLGGVLGLVATLRQKDVTVPIVLFTYFNPLLRMGLEKFALACRASGVSGVLIVDLPPEEAASYRKPLDDQQIETVFLASPTTDPSRLQSIQGNATGFVYYVSRTGVTGVQSQLTATLADEVNRVKRHIQKPLLVGFGISEPGQAREVAEHADGVVIGSALVKIIEGAAAGSPERAARQLEDFARGIVSAIDPQISRHSNKAEAKKKEEGETSC